MHEIESFAFANEVPWHGLGNQVSNEMSAQEMLEASGCDWEVQLTQNHYPPNHPTHPSEPVPKSYFIERMSDGSILGEHVVGTAYTPFQNIEMFNFFQEFLDKNQMYLHTAGSLYNGKKVFCMATTKEGFTLGKNDTVVNNLLFTINHTGTEANSALITPIRVVCANTMRLAMDRGKKDVVKHSHKVEFDAESMKTALGISSEQFGKFEEFAIAMAKRVLTGTEEIEFFRYVFGGKEREQDGKLIQPEGVRKALAYNRGQEFRALGDRSKKETKQAIIDRQGKENDHLRLPWMILLRLSNLESRYPKRILRNSVPVTRMLSPILCHHHLLQMIMLLSIPGGIMTVQKVLCGVLTRLLCSCQIIDQFGTMAMISVWIGHCMVRQRGRSISKLKPRIWR